MTRRSAAERSGPEADGSRGGGRLGACFAVALVLLFPLQVSGADDWVSADKGLHFALSAAITLGGYGLSVPLLDERWERSLFAACLGIAAGAGKEVADALGSGDPSARDFAWDLLGVAVGVGIGVLVDTLVDVGDDSEAPVSLSFAESPAPSLSLRFAF